MTTPTVYFDTETTGLSALRGDEIVELAIIDDEGQTLLETFVRPLKKASWPEAEKIHGISPEMVKDAPTLQELVPLLIEHFSERSVVIYNAGYDMAFMPPAVRDAPASVDCAMQRFAEHYGDFSEYHQTFTWQPLARAARYVHHQWHSTAHRALSDAHAARAVWRYLRDDDERARVDALRAMAAEGELAR